MVADFLVTFFATGILICIVYVIANVKKLRDEKREMFVYQQKNKDKFADYDHHFEQKQVFAKEKSFHQMYDDEVFASIEEEI